MVEGLGLEFETSARGLLKRNPVQYSMSIFIVVRTYRPIIFLSLSTVRQDKEKFWILALLPHGTN